MKEFLSCDAQLNKLEASGLIIKDRNAAKKYLQTLGYYNLINGYSKIFKYDKEKDGKKGYKENITFNDIVTLYNFDKDLRSIVIKYTESIERYFKETMAHIFSEVHGVDQTIYLSDKCFSSKDPKKLESFLNECNRNIERAQEKGKKTYREYLAEHYKKYQHVPFWILIRTFPFGKGKYIFRLLLDEEREKIAKVYELSVEKFEPLLEIAVAFRNIAAHGERLYCTKISFIDDIITPEYSIVRKLQIPISSETGKIMYGRTDFTAFLITCKYLLRVDEFNSLISDVNYLLNVLKNSLSLRYYVKILEKMNLQRKSWKNLPKMLIED